MLLHACDPVRKNPHELIIMLLLIKTYFEWCYTHISWSMGGGIETVINISVDYHLHDSESVTERATHTRPGDFSFFPS